MSEQIDQQISKVKVAVCIITYRRPDGLARLLDALNELTFKSDTPVLEIVVVDNDPEGSAREVCERLRGQLRWPLDYSVEAQRGISPARNAAMARAAPKAKWLAFIDDDEVPEPEWLDELLKVQQTYDADVVGGPVVARFAEPPPRWIVRGGFFDSPRYETGQQRDRAYTGNVLFRSEILDKLETLFDERFSLMGGEDSHFFRRVHRAGFKIVWADRAVVFELNPPTRTRLGWLIKRSYRNGNSTTAIEIDLHPSWSIRLVLAAKAAVWLGLGAGLTISGLILGRHILAKGVRAKAYGIGLLLGIFGSRYEEYRETDGT